MPDPAPGAAIGRARLRREARERALELSYEHEQRDGSLDELLSSLTLEPDPFTIRLLRAVEAETAQIDAEIASRLRGWTFERLPLLDRLVLRLAIAELRSTDTPTGVVLAEAVDLAARYGTDESSRFVNGVLAAVSNDRSRPASGPIEG